MVTDPEKISERQEARVLFGLGFEEQKKLQQKYFSAAVIMEISPLSGIAKEIYGQGYAEIDKFFGGTMFADERGKACQGLCDKRLDTCEEEDCHCPLFGSSMGTAGLEVFTANSAAWSWTLPSGAITPGAGSAAPGS